MPWYDPGYVQLRPLLNNGSQRVVCLRDLVRTPLAKPSGFALNRTTIRSGANLNVRKRTLSE